MTALGTAWREGENRRLNLGAFNHGFANGAGQSNSNVAIDSLTGVVNALAIYSRVRNATEIEAVEAMPTNAYLNPEPASLAVLVIAALGSYHRARSGWRMTGKSC